VGYDVTTGIQIVLFKDLACSKDNNYDVLIPNVLHGNIS